MLLQNARNGRNSRNGRRVLGASPQADTKMLRAGWGDWGSPASTATISSEMMHADVWASRSGEGFRTRREIADASLRARLWDECVALTGAVYE